MAKKQKEDTKIKELEDQLKRALADYQNLEKRVEEQKSVLSTLYTAIIIEKFLPVLDSLESAQDHIQDQGLQMVIKQFKDVLKSEGVEEITAEGAEFDPNLHEAIEIKNGPNKNTIVKVLKKGYKIGEKVIRAAQVVVEKPQVEEEIIQEVAENV